MNISRKIHKPSCLFLFSIGLVLDLTIGVADYLTGYNLSMSAFYLAPIGFVSWFVSRRIGILMSLICTATVSLADFLSGKIYLHYLIEIWNTSLLLSFFLIVAFLLSGLKLEVEKRERVIQELQKALEEIKTLSGLLPICAWCKKIRDDKGYWQQVEHYIAEHSQAEFTHGICPECLKTISPDSYDRLTRNHSKQE